MPRIPEYQQQFPLESLNKVNGPRLAPQQGLNLNADMFGAGAARGLQQAGHTLLYAGIQGMRMMHEYNLAKTQEAVNTHQKKLIPLFYGPEGVFNLKGEAALDAPERVTRAIQDTAKEVEGTLGNDFQKAFFMSDVEQMHLRVLPQAVRLAADQRDAWMTQTYMDKAQIKLDEAAANYTDPNAYRQSLVQGGLAIETAGRLQGLSEDSIKLRKAKYTSQGYSTIAEAYISQSKYNAAEGLIKSGVINGVDALKLQEHINRKQQVDAQHALVLQHEAERNAAKSFDDKLSILLEHGRMDEAIAFVVNNAPLGYKKEGFALVDQYAKGQRVVTNEGEAWKWQQLLVNDPQKFMDTWNPTEHLSTMDKTTRSNFTSQWENLSKGDKTQYDQVVADANILDEAYKAMDIRDAKKATGDDLSRIMEFNRQFQEQVDIFAQEKKRKPSSTEKIGIRDNMLLIANETGALWWKEKTYLFETSKEPERPKGLPASATWNRARQGWSVGNKFLSAKDVQNEPSL